MELYFNLLLFTHLHLNDPEKKKEGNHTGNLCLPWVGNRTLHSENRASILRIESGREREREQVRFRNWRERKKRKRREREGKREGERKRIKNDLARGSREQPGLSEGTLDVFSGLSLPLLFGEWNDKSDLGSNCSAPLMS